MTVYTKLGTGFITVSWDSGHTSNVHRSDGHDFGPLNSPMTDWCPPCKRALTYTVLLGNRIPSNPSNPSLTSYVCCATKQSAYLTVIGQDNPENPFGSFVFLVPLGNIVLQYLHVPGEIVKGPWQLARSLQITPDHAVLDTSLSLIQSSSKNLEAMVQVGERIVPFGHQEGSLLGYELMTGGEWSTPITLQADGGPISHVTGSQALIQSYRDGQDQFELLVPSHDVIFHYTHNAKSILDGRWSLVAELPLPPALGNILEQRTAVSLLQSTSDELDALVTTLGVLLGYVLEKGNNWSGPFEIQSDQGPIEGITGAPALIQRDENTFDLVVAKGAELLHYTLENQPFQKGVWKLVAKLDPPENNMLIQTVSMALTQNAAGQLELATRARPPLGLEDDFMVGYVYDQGTNLWQHPMNLEDENGQKLIAKDALSSDPKLDEPR